MSYHIDLEADLGGPEPINFGYDWNYTRNCSPMWRLAGADLAAFDGRTAGECEPILRAAVDRMRADPAPYIKLNPDNGWGSYGTLLPWLEELADGFARAPRATVRVSR